MSSSSMGKKSERSIRDRLKVLWPKVRRGLPQSAGAIEADLEELPVRAEVKSWTRWPDVESALRQVAEDAYEHKDDRPRAVFHRRKNRQKKFRTDWRVSFELEEFIRFVYMVRKEGRYGSSEGFLESDRHARPTRATPGDRGLDLLVTDRED